MDQLNAHLDRGWDLLNKGDLRGARQSAKRAIQLAPDSPESHSFLGHVAHREGELDEAVEHFQHALSLDDLYLDPMLSLAELYMGPLERFDEAIDLCDDVLDMAEAPQDRADAVLLKFEAMYLRGDELAECRKVLEGLPPGPYESPQTLFLAGRAWFDLGEMDKAEALFREQIAAEPKHPDAWYQLALIHESRSEWRATTEALLRVRSFDLEAPRPQWSVTQERFTEMVAKALGTLDPAVQEALKDAMVMVLEAPSIESIAQGIDPRMPVFIDGVDDRDADLPPTDLARFIRVFVYQRNAEPFLPDVTEAVDLLSDMIRAEYERAAHGVDGGDAGISPELPTSVRAAEAIPPSGRKRTKPGKASLPPPPKDPTVKKPAPKKPRKKG